jgi:hypothetical protein
VFFRRVPISHNYKAAKQEVHTRFYRVKKFYKRKAKAEGLQLIDMVATFSQTVIDLTGLTLNGTEFIVAQRIKSVEDLALFADTDIDQLSQTPCLVTVCASHEATQAERPSGRASRPKRPKARIPEHYSCRRGHETYDTRSTRTSCSLMISGDTFE